MKLLKSRVIHKRLFPKVNYFSYKTFCLSIPLKEISSFKNSLLFSINKKAVFSFFEKDHEIGAESGLENQMRSILKSHQINHLVEEIDLITMPRIFGYAFNPVSFWLCFDSKKEIIAVLSEVNNTFGESHNYLCLKKNGESIKKNEWIRVKKTFHVSPFLERKGFYDFCFSNNKKSLAVLIDYFDENNNKKLATSITGNYLEFNQKNLMRLFFSCPFVTFKIIYLIHWQALKLVLKGIKYIPKPPILKEKITNN